MGNDIEIGKCSICNKENISVSRTLYQFAILCECHDGFHKEVVYTCNNCLPKIPNTLRPVLLANNYLFNDLDE